MLVRQQRKTVGKKRILRMAKLHNCMMPKHWLESLSEARLSWDEMTLLSHVGYICSAVKS